MADLGLDGSDIDEDRLASLLFTDSDDEPGAPAPPSPLPTRRLSVGKPARSGIDDILGTLDDDLFDGLAGPKLPSSSPSTRPAPVAARAAATPPKKPKKQSASGLKKKDGDKKKRKSADRDAALKQLALDEEIEKSIASSLGSIQAPADGDDDDDGGDSGKRGGSARRSSIGPIVVAAAAAAIPSRRASVEPPPPAIAAHDEFLDGLFDEAPIAAAAAVASATAAAPTLTQVAVGKVAVVEATPSSTTTDPGSYIATMSSSGTRRRSLPPRAGRRQHEASLPTPATTAPPSNAAPSSIAASLGGAVVLVPAAGVAGSGAAPLEPLSAAPAIAFAPIQTFGAMSLPAASASSFMAPAAAEPALDQAHPAASPYPTAAVNPPFMSPVAAVASLIAPVNVAAATSINWNATASSAPTSLSRAANPTSLPSRSAEPAPAASVELLSAEFANRIRQLTDENAIVTLKLTKVQHQVDRLEKDKSDLQQRLSAELDQTEARIRSITADYTDREVQFSKQVEQRNRAQTQQLNDLHEKALSSRDRLHADMIQNLETMHRSELESIRRQAEEAAILTSLASQVEHSASTLDSMQRDIRREIDVTEESRRTGIAHRETQLKEKERQFEGEVARHAAVVATFEELSRQQESGRERVKQEEDRLQSMQQFWIAETAALKGQIQLERQALQDEKREFDHDRSSWRMTQVAARAELDSLTNAARRAMADAQSREEMISKINVDANRTMNADQQGARADRELAAVVRQQAEADQARIGQESNQLCQQRRHLEQKMAEVLSLGEKVHMLSEKAKHMWEEGQANLLKAARLGTSVSEGRRSLEADRATLSSTKSFIDAEQIKMEQQRLELSRSKHDLLVQERRFYSVKQDRRSRTSQSQHQAPTRGAIYSSKPIRLPEEMTTMKKEPIPTAPLSPEVILDLNRMRLKASEAAMYAQSEGSSTSAANRLRRHA